MSSQAVLEDLTEPQAPTQNVVLEGENVRGLGQRLAPQRAWTLSCCCDAHFRCWSTQTAHLTQATLPYQTLRKDSEVGQIWNEWRPLPFANHYTSRRTATINRLTEITMRSPVFVSTVAIWASAASGSHLQTSCLNQCSEAQKEFAVAQGNREILCACNSIFLKKVDGCFTCLVTQDVCRYLTPWVALLMYCNPRKEECLA